MGSRIILLAVIFSLTFATIAKSEETISMAYFQVKPQVGYTYERLAPDNSGDQRDRYVTCVNTGKINGELVGLHETISYFGQMKIPRYDLYSFVGRRVYQNATSNQLTGKREFLSRPVVLIVPSHGMEESWENNDGGELTKCKSRLIPSVKIKGEEFSDVVLVEKEFRIDGRNVKCKEYYAKGYGLVKTETFFGGKFEGTLSSNLIKIE